VEKDFSEISEAFKLKEMNIKMSGSDIRVEGYPERRRRCSPE
jgi:hypothetical protein